MVPDFFFPLGFDYQLSWFSVVELFLNPFCFLIQLKFILQFLLLPVLSFCALPELVLSDQFWLVFISCFILIAGFQLFIALGFLNSCLLFCIYLCLVPILHESSVYKQFCLYVFHLKGWLFYRLYLSHGFSMSPVQGKPCFLFLFFFLLQVLICIWVHFRKWNVIPTKFGKNL